jgi:hypothetical protein
LRRRREKQLRKGGEYRLRSERDLSLLPERQERQRD